jgi:hypothetical protein
MNDQASTNFSIALLTANCLQELQALLKELVADPLLDQSHCFYTADYTVLGQRHEGVVQFFFEL